MPNLMEPKSRSKIYPAASKLADRHLLGAEQAFRSYLCRCEPLHVCLREQHKALLGHPLVAEDGLEGVC